MEVALESLQVEELRALLHEKNVAAQDLTQEIDRLKQAPLDFEERLNKLEDLFKNFGPSDTIKIRSPLLLSVAQTMSLERARLHNESVLEHRQRDPSTMEDGEAHHDPHTHHDATDFVLGRKCMTLDQVAAKKQKELAEHGRRLHPVITKVHYAGHLVKPTEEVDPIFVGPGQVEYRRPLGPAPRHGEFWLDATYRKRQEEEEAQAAQMEFVRQAEEERAKRAPHSAFLRDRPGRGEDVLPKDWLGEAKRRGVEM